MKIFINAGHATTYDCGAVGASGSKESEINLQIAEVTAKALKQAGHKVTLYQQQRKLADVTAKANQSKADIFVAIHCNGSVNKTANGTETWHYTGCPIGAKYAKAIQAELVKTLGTKDRGVKESTSLYVLRKTIMPAVLVEVAFITNLEEEKLVLANIEKIGQSIAKAILKTL
jgi:N-acetylmuramoyl-L-alanine amidase